MVDKMEGNHKISNGKKGSSFIFLVQSLDVKKIYKKKKFRCLHVYT